jgi:hypothetical protein
MRWFRTNRQFGARLALITLALQLVLTFGHVHALLANAAGTAVSASQSGGWAPLDGGHKGLADFDCPTCALILLSSVSAPSAAPQLPLPDAMDFVTPRPRTRLVAAIAPHASFQARAPPAV